MRPVLFHIGDIAIPSFWAMAFLGFFVGLLVVRRDMIERGYDVRYAYDMVLWAYVGGWVGARLFVIPTGWNYFVEDPIAFLLSSSGWVWYGGVDRRRRRGAVLGAQRVGIPVAVVADIAAPALAIGLAIGRIGCQLAGDGDYGVPTDLPVGHELSRRRRADDRARPPDADLRDGRLPRRSSSCSGGSAAAAAAGPSDRAVPDLLRGRRASLVEFLRRNPDWLLGLTTAQWFSLGSIAIGAWLRRPAKAPTTTKAPQARPLSAPLWPPCLLR